MSTDKITELDALSQAVEDMYEEFYAHNTFIGDSHHILYSGNIDADTAVVKMHPNPTEVYWAKKKNVHSDCLFIDNEGDSFKKSATTAGFKPANDFLYLSLIPFYPKIKDGYDDETISNNLWIFDGIIEISGVKNIITLGYRTSSLVAAYYGKNLDFDEFEDNIKLNESIYLLKDKILVPLEEPPFVKDGCFKTLQRLNTYKKFNPQKELQYAGQQ